MRVTDHTAGFEWPARIALPEPDSERGRGLYLIGTLMRNVRYLRSAEENLLVMRHPRARIAFPLPAEAPSDLAECQRRLAENEQVLSQMIEELSSCYEILAAIFRFGAEQARPGSLQDFSRRLLGDMLRILKAEWFVVRLQPEGEARLEVFVASNPALDLESIALPSTPSEARSVEAIAAATGQDVWFDQHRPLVPGDPLGHVKPEAAGLAHPFSLGGKLLGTLTVGKPIPPAPSPGAETCVAFTAGQTNVINTFGDLLAIQIVNARFHEQTVNRRVVARELEIARTIQRSLLIQTLPQVRGFSLAASCDSASNVGGDFYDVLQINEDTLMFAIADVMGKGVPAAMFATILRTLLRATPDWNLDPAALLARINRILFKDLAGVDMFITVQVAILEAARRRLVIAGAGHCPLMLIIPGETAARAIAPEGMPLGILQDTHFATETVDLPSGASALLYTDGLTEALDAAGERYGQERLLQWLHEHGRATGDANALRAALASELAQFQRNTALNDDQTFIILSG
jgi:serine phosphatase RsbU (regulator of sigma subunit)